MIQFVENDQQKRRLYQLSEETAFGCKMAAVIRSYGFDKGFACFWLEDKSGCAYCLMDGGLIISGTPQDLAEAKQFLLAVGPGTVMASASVTQALGLSPTQHGEVLKKDIKAPPTAPPPLPVEPPIREIHGLLEVCGMSIEFEPFYLDLSLKLRRGTALALTEYRDRALAGCAVVSSVSAQGAVLSALAVAEPLRGRGIGSALLEAAQAHLAGKTLYIFREEGANAPFYRRHKFVHEDDWAYTVLKEEERHGTLL